MKVLLRRIPEETVVYDALMFSCPGCAAGGPEGYEGIHLLPVNTRFKRPSWKWNGDLENPTLTPSIKTDGYALCHSFLKDGVFQFLLDSDHPLAGQYVPMPELPKWAEDIPYDDESDDDG